MPGIIMEVVILYGTENIDWEELCELFRLAPLGTREPERLKLAAENSHTELLVALCRTKLRH